jgi:pimeloyl-ACP methyl ester carboxylesterase
MPTHSDPELRTAPVSGTSLAYIEAGAGEPIVLVHGTLVDYRCWGGLMALLGRQFRVIAYSRRYHYPNATTGSADYSAAQHTADLVELITGLDLGRVHLAGHSSGGVIALLLARQHPELVRSLTLIEPGLYSILPVDDEACAALAQMTAMARAARDDLERGDASRAVRLMIDFALRPAGFAGVPHALQEAMLQNASSLRILFSTRALPPLFDCEEARQVQLPVLLLNGEQTAWEFRRINQELARCLPQARLVKIPGTGHALPFERPEAVSQAILDFLAGGHSGNYREAAR